MTELPISQILCGDAAELMRGLPSNSIHAIVTDPPYNLSFMGEEFDTIGDMKTYQEWTTKWAKEALRVLLPGASMLVMGGTRTYHRMACGVEDAGFEIKDTILWCYNSGFPKAHDLGKLIDRRNERNWRPEVKDYLNAKRKEKELSFNQINEMLGAATSGGGTASDLMGDKRFSKLPTRDIYNRLKVILDLDDRFDELIEREEAEREVIGLGEGAGTKGNTFPFEHEYDVTIPATLLAREWDGWKVGGLKPSYEPIIFAVKPPEGSTTDNVLKHKVGAIHVDACRIPFEGDDDTYEKGIERAKTPRADITGGKFVGYGGRTKVIESGMSPEGRYPANMIRTDRFEDGYDRFYFVAKADRSERDAGLEGMPTKDVPYSEYRENFADTESWVSKYPDGKTRPMNKIRNTHPTVKPIALMEHLIKLVTRLDQIVLDPFVGSGTTCIAARKLLRQYIGIDNNAEYCEIAKKRLAAIPPPLEVFA